MGQPWLPQNLGGGWAPKLFSVMAEVQKPPGLVCTNRFQVLSTEVDVEDQEEEFPVPAAELNVLEGKFEKWPALKEAFQKVGEK